MSIVKSSLPLAVVLAAAIPCAAVAQSPAPTTPPTPPPTETVQPAKAPLTDADILMVLSTINEIGMEHARVAQKTAKDRRVKKFADSKVKRYGAAKKRQSTLRTRLKLQPSGSAVNDTLKQELETTYRDLKDQDRGAAFDRAFIDDEIEALTNIQETVNNQLLPAVILPQLRTELQTVRSQVESDLKAAQRLQTALHKPTT